MRVPGVGPYWIGDDAKQSATDYAEERAKFGRGEIRVLNPDWSLERVIAFNQRGPTNDIQDLLELDDQH